MDLLFCPSHWYPQSSSSLQIPGKSQALPCPSSILLQESGKGLPLLNSPPSTALLPPWPPDSQLQGISHSTELPNMTCGTSNGKAGEGLREGVSAGVRLRTNPLGSSLPSAQAAAPTPVTSPGLEWCCQKNSYLLEFKASKMLLECKGKEKSQLKTSFLYSCQLVNILQSHLQPEFAQFWLCMRLTVK